MHIHRQVKGHPLRETARLLEEAGDRKSQRDAPKEAAARRRRRCVGRLQRVQDRRSHRLS